LNGRVDRPAPAERGKDFGWFGLEVFENEGLGLAAADPAESGRGVNLGPAGFFRYFANAFLGWVNSEGCLADGGDENLLGRGFEVFANESLDPADNESLDPADEDARKREERGPEPDRFGLAPARAGEPAGSADIDGREPARGLNLVPLPGFA
jgi:hypothetical protein